MTIYTKSPIFLILAFLCNFTSKAYEVDSCLVTRISQEIASIQSDQQKFEYLDSMWGASDGDEEFAYAKAEYELAEPIGNKKYMLKGLYGMARQSYCASDYHSSLNYGFQALMIAEEDGDLSFKFRICKIIANNYSMISNPKSIEYYKKALVYAYQLDDRDLIIEVLNAIWQEEIESDMLNEAFADREKIRSLIFNNDSSTVEQMAGFYYLSGTLDYQQHFKSYSLSNLSLAKAALYKSIELYNSPSVLSSEKSYMCRVYCNLSDTYKMESEFYSSDKAKFQNAVDSCRFIADKGIELANKYGEGIARFNLFLTKAESYTTTSQFAEAEEILDSLASELDGKDYANSKLYYLSSTYIELYKKMSDINKLSHWQGIYIECLNSTDRAELYAGTSLIASEAEYEQEKNRNEIERIALEKSVKWRRAVIALLCVCVLVFISFWIKTRKQNRRLNAQNDLLADQHEEIRVQNESLEKQKAIITKANEDIQSSIRYAKQIQEAVMPDAQQINSFFPENMVMLHPLNIVSGDFYWIGRVGDARVLAVGDCTGHGVPGAVLSMLGMSLLNEITSSMQSDNLSAAHILDLLNEKFKAALRQTGDVQSNHDSIDIAVAVIDNNKKELHYAGAFRPLIVAGAQGLTRIGADRQPIGVSWSVNLFTDNVIPYTNGDTIYMYSDGITDQFGCENGRVVKFGHNRLYSLIGELCTLPMADQITKFNQVLDQWRTNPDGTKCEQLDDMIFVGVKLS